MMLVQQKPVFVPKKEGQSPINPSFGMLQTIDL